MPLQNATMRNPADGRVALDAPLPAPPLDQRVRHPDDLPHWLPLLGPCLRLDRRVVTRQLPHAAACSVDGLAWVSAAPAPSLASCEFRNGWPADGLAGGSAPPVVRMDSTGFARSASYPRRPSIKVCATQTTSPTGSHSSGHASASTAGLSLVNFHTAPPAISMDSPGVPRRLSSDPTGVSRRLCCQRTRLGFAKHDRL